ncbi:DNRLRE domain-containing protein [Saccharothrix sp. S26]|uniref:LamG-like jellyroll fold domain-containing protein n=1 Tax=Saccharothrix sp. S26 TaxID=2907215 RepID=UPI001F3FF91A|nr:LamG-like jellyroll fold domain-containing protein [Saccharothrix sp. S26]MCE6995373.1 DNRLRE domain-containing protein [Saccharothrix sp. S26]
MRGVVLFAVLSVIAAFVLVSVQPWTSAPPPDPAPVAEAPDELSASLAARRQGTRVEVAGLRTETATTYANPSGTWTVEQSVGPVRVRRGDDWVPVDTDLTTTSDGGLAPKAGPVDVRLSGGGATPLARVAAGGAELTLTWPRALPVPHVDGDTATYPDVLPGVDLRVRATDQGFGHDLVVRTREAAADPALARVRFGLATKGLSLRADEAGNLSATDASGAVVHSAAAPLMWDSPDGDAPRTERRVGVELGDGTLTLLPDPALLADPAARLPIVIDPYHSFTTPMAHNSWTLIRQAFPGQANWNLRPHDEDTRIKGVARIGHAPGYASDFLDRSVFQFNLDAVRGADVIGATFKVYQVWKYANTCDTAAVDNMVLHVTDPIGPGTTWTSHWNKFWGQQAWPRSAAKLGQPCGPDWVGVNVTGAVEAGANQNGLVTLGLRAGDETGDAGWKRFYVQDGYYPKIEIEYNRRPLAPTDLRTEPALSPCHWCAGVTYAPDTTLSLTGVGSDPDGGQVTASWLIGSPALVKKQALSSGLRARTSIETDAYADGTKVDWTLGISDGELAGPVVRGPSFTVDTTPPSDAPTIASPTYPADNAWHGGAGVPGTFTFTPPAADGDIDHYRYGWTTPPTTKVLASSLGGPGTVTTAPPADGVQTLYVQSVDKAGNESGIREHHTHVRAGNGARSQWSFEGNAQDTAFLGDRHGTVHGPTTYQPGAVGNAVRFERGGTVTAPRAVSTDASFTAAAWVRLDDVVHTHTAVSQSGAAVAGFELGYRTEAGAGHWFVRMATTPTATATVVTAQATQPAAEDTWTHLAGVYDAEKGELRLYVNGVLSATVVHRSTWNADGEVHIGNALLGGGYQNHWLGGVDEVQLFDRAVGTGELKAMVGSSNVQLAHWKFDERAVSSQPGRTAANAVPGGQAAVLGEEGAEFVTPGASGDRGTGALHLDGRGHATTNEPTLRTDQSFTIAAWARLDATGGDTRPVVSQHGTNTCGVCLQYQATTDRWVFVLPRSDDVNPPTGYDFVQSKQAAVADDWVHLVGIHDASVPEIRFYVDGELAGRQARTVGWRATGALRIGGGNLDDHFVGDIDEVRLYSRAISDDEIRGIVSAEGVSEGSWKLDGTADDSSGKSRDGGLVGDPSWVAGQTTGPDPADLAVRLSGSGQHVSAPNAVDTTRSFSVSAWARVDQAGRQASVVSQSGATLSGFTLRSTAGGRWSFAMPRLDISGGGGIDEALGTPVQSGVWTHLVGVYSRDRGRVELYVNGLPAGSAAHTTTTFNATGNLLIGRSKMDSDFAGAVDDVSVHGRPLFVDEIRAMAGRDLTLVHNWQLDERGGATAADSVGTRGGALSGGAAFTSGRVGNSVHLDGVDDVVSTSGVDLDVASGFTVSSWVRLDGYTCATACRYTAVSLDGAQHSKFRLGHQVDTAQGDRGYWVFELPEPDGSVTEAAVSVLPGEVNKWVHLTGVYDAATGKVWLYVNGTRVDDGTLLTPWAAGGALRIGRGQAGGAASGYWKGDVDEVRMHTGALDKARVSALYRSFPAPAAPAELPDADAGHWTFDEAVGTVAADANGRLPATLRGGATWIGGRDRAAGWFDGTSGYAETAGPALRTEQSFSVAAWAYLASGITTDRTVAGQDGAQAGAFRLGYDATARRWSVVVAPAAAGAQPVSLTSTEVAGPADWTHLVVTYEQSTGELRLYVNGVLSGLRLGVVVPGSAGPFTIGRGKANGGPTGYFPRGIDDVRAYSRALTDGEVRRVHDAAPAIELASWRFDADSGEDHSGRGNPVTPGAGVSYVDGVSGRALSLDGVDDSAVAASAAVTMRSSFTVSAWARLSRADRVATVVAQDGSRMSGYALQYRPELNRWVFGTRLSDSDGAEAYHVRSAQPARVGVWTHLVGIYDSAARELRIYVDGQPAGARGTGALWPATGALTIGRSKVDGVGAEYFPGAIDEVRADLGMVSDQDIAERAGWPPPPAGLLGSFADVNGERRTMSTSSTLPAGYRMVAPLGTLPAADTPGTHPLYACASGTGDGFTSRQETCEGGTALGTLGPVFTDPPEGVPSMPVYRCAAGGGERFDATDCGAGATVEVPLGHTIAYAPYARYYSRTGRDHWSTTGGTLPGYRLEHVQGWVPLVPLPGTVPLLSCRTGVDEFSSTRSDCEGGRNLGVIGYVWPVKPAEVDTRQVYRCTVNGQRFVSTREDCEGRQVEGPLGYITYPSPVPAA